MDFFVSETPPCFSARLTARPGARPVCRPDGTYAPVQCHAETGYCWCVTPQGRPLPDTSVKHQRPRCTRSGPAGPSPGGGASIRSGQRRRASPNWKQRRQYTNRHRNTCDRAEKSKFNTNLIENFKIEYRRTNISAEGTRPHLRKEKTKKKKKRFFVHLFLTMRQKISNGATRELR